LSTFHRAKGLQWPTVIVLGLNAGLLPIGSALTHAAVEEERRLLYVALTRAEEELWCSWFASADGMTRQPSPWLEPIERTIRRLERDAAPTAASEVPARVAELRRRLDQAEQQRPDPEQDR
jgi:DNA helicase-2/ATP-dependent DNA helicase PcrA